MYIFIKNTIICQEIDQVILSYKFCGRQIFLLARNRFVNNFEFFAR